MNDQQRACLLIASRLLSYPANTDEERTAIHECIEEDIDSNALKMRLYAASSAIFDLDELERKETYVSTFDLRSKLGLYLTGHEFGDSNKRGAAIIQLQKVISKSGFERVDDELADYIPMLFEYLVVAPEDENSAWILRRLAVAVQRMKDSISGDNPYAIILYVLMEFIFDEPTKEEIEKLEFEREDADLENLPYPMLYQ
ncbi:MAG TPA: nitrate reductase molybdenum cofactor assembly chaperone [Virgibacillus sp.]|nr:nitrate reductase molybdenum cofactor assembly chaperone [Virgibacillus sp.]